MQNISNVEPTYGLADLQALFLGREPDTMEIDGARGQIAALAAGASLAVRVLERFLRGTATDADLHVARRASVMAFAIMRQDVEAARDLWPQVAEAFEACEVKQ